MLPSLRTTLIALAGGSMIATAPAHADDDTKTGLIAGLGVAAATGKTSLGDGGGKIEAGLLSADAFQQAAAVIAGVVRDARPGQRRIVILPGDTTIDLLSPALITERLKELNTLIAEQCAKKPEEVPAAPQEKNFDLKFHFPKGTQPMVSDVTGAALTDVSIGGIALEANDRRLANALLMDVGGTPVTLTSAWQHWPIPEAASGTSAADSHTSPFAVIGEGSAPDTTSPIRKAYKDLRTTLVATHRNCLTSEAVTARDAGDALVANLTDASKGPSVLSTAIQIEAAAMDGTTSPLLLRIAIEQIGGTSIARSGILYTFGWPDAVTVSAGLMVSFRLYDPKSARLRAVGEVRCLTPATNIKKVADRLGEMSATTRCGFRGRSFTQTATAQ